MLAKWRTTTGDEDDWRQRQTIGENVDPCRRKGGADNVQTVDDGEAGSTPVTWRTTTPVDARRTTCDRGGRSTTGDDGRTREDDEKDV
nr:unnamed protein product [Digitaria exilis]